MLDGSNTRWWWAKNAGPKACSGPFNHLPGNLAEFGYDAAYVLIYAVARANWTFPTGSQLAVALNELACKADGKLDLVPCIREFSAKLQDAADGDCIDREGASSPLDFDANGEALSVIAPLNLADPRWCPPAP